MNFRAFGAAVAALAILWWQASPSAAQAQPVPLRSDRPSLVAAIRTLRVNGGPYDGAVRQFAGGGINWYLSNLALWHVVRDDPAFVRAYLDAYVRNVDPLTATISDVESGSGGVLSIAVTPDSHDAYAATFLRLAVRYVRATNDVAWLNRNLAALKAMAYDDILTLVKPNGLVRVFRNPPPGGIPAEQAAIGYLMDNCEDYRGLADFAALLAARSDAEAPYYRTFLRPLASAIATLFDAKAGAWRYSDDDAAPAVTLYPDCLAQLFPETLGIPGRANAPAVRSAARRFVAQRCRSLLETGPADITALLGYQIAATRSDPALARRLRAAAFEAVRRAPASANVVAFGWLLGSGPGGE